MVKPGLYLYPLADEDYGPFCRVIGTASMTDGPAIQMVVYVDQAGRWWIREEDGFLQFADGTPRFTLVREIETKLITPGMLKGL